MSVLIKGMAMPKGCLGCPCINAKYNECMILQRRATNVMTRMTDCPLIELPDHGDLIDRDALMTRYAEEVRPSNNSDFMRPPRWNDAVQLTELAPAVIPAERSEDND